MRRYIALIRPDADRGFIVTLPDFPGLVAGAETLDKLRERAAGALAAHIDAIEQRGASLPAASSFDALMADPRHAESAAMLVSAADARPAQPIKPRPTPPPEGNPNDEWPEADA